MNSNNDNTTNDTTTNDYSDNANDDDNNIYTEVPLLSESLLWLTPFLPEANFGLRVLSLTAFVWVSGCPCICESIPSLLAR